MKHTRLLEIIREEITSALNEISQLNEDPFISPSQYDISYNKETGEVEKGILGKTIENAVNIIKSMGVESTPEISKIITAKKARTSPNSPPELISALTAIDNAVLKQGETLDKTGEIIKIVQKIASQPKSDLPDVSPFISGEKSFSDILQRPQTEKAIDRILGVEPGQRGPKAKPKSEKPESTGKKGRPADAAKEKTVILTKGDDGFDTVEYSDDKGSAEAMKSAGSDKTAKALGKIAYSKKLTPEEETQYETALKGIKAKIKRIEDGEEKPDDRTLLKKTYQNSEIQRLFKAKGSNLNDILKGIIG